MAAVRETTTLARRILAEAAAWYAENPVPRAFRGCDPLVLAVAADLSGGDWRKCIADADGSITVCKNRVWNPRAE